MPARRPQSTITAELHRMVAELHAHSAETRVLIATVVERLEKVEAKVAEQGRALTWYDFVAKSLKAAIAALIVLLTLRFGDLSDAIRRSITGP